jgi:hypothetical protein
MMTRHRNRLVALHPAASTFVALVFAFIIFLSAAAIAQTATPPSATSSTDPEGNIALAERLAMLSRVILSSARRSPPLFREAEETLRAAGRLDPSESRFAKSRYEAAMAAGDTDDAVDAIKAFRAIDPGEETAQIAQISLYLYRMETADQQLAYINQLLSRPQIPAEVRSWADMRAADLYYERHQQAKTVASLTDAIRLNPLNYDAQYQKYLLQSATLKPAERISCLLALARCNPGDPRIAAAVADEAANAALVGPSLYWYTFAFNLYNQRFFGPTPEDMVRGYAAELYVSGETIPSLELLKQYQTARPDDTLAWMMRLAIEKPLDANGSFDAVSKQAQIAFADNLAEIGKVAGNNSATTRPVDSAQPQPLPDFDADIKNIGAISDPSRQARVKAAYVENLTDTAWYYIYFQRDTATGAKLLAAAAQLDPKLPTSDYAVALRGWIDLIDGHLDDARDKFTSVQDRQPYAALGLIQLDMNNILLKSATAAKAKRLLSQHPAGPLGALLFAALNQMTGSLPTDGNSDEIRAEFDGFPRQWLDAAGAPNTFYSVRVEPLQASYRFGEPMLARVTVRNVSNYDLTIGSAALIKPTVVFDARIQGLDGQDVSAVAFDEFGVGSGPNMLTPIHVLHPNQEVSNIDRLDDGKLLSIFQAKPLAASQVSFFVVTNPLPSKTGDYVPGPAGFRSEPLDPFNRVTQSLATPDGRTRAFDALATGAPADKIDTLDEMHAYLAVLAKTAPDQMTDDDKQAYGDIARRLLAATTDATPAVRAWASYIMARLSPKDTRTELVARMCKDPQWPVRMLGLLVAETLPDGGDSWVSTLAAAETDPNLKALAQARLDQEQYEKDNPETKQPAATQPGVTQPAATQPGVTQPDATQLGATRPDAPAAATGSASDSATEGASGAGTQPAATPGQ